MLALTLGFAHAGDDEQARFERSVRTPADGLVGLAEVLPALGVADDRPVDTELAQHRRGDLARERAGIVPVDVLCGDRDLRAGQQLHCDRE